MSPGSARRFKNAEMLRDRLIAWFKKNYKDNSMAIIAFSGGVDSSVIAKAAFIALEKNAIAVTANSRTFPEYELLEAKKIADEIGIEHIIIEEDELKDERVRKNTEQRCYFCRSNLAAALKKFAEKHAERKGYIIVDGANRDDQLDYRPGLKALKEHGVRSPLIELGIGKEEVREIAKIFKLSNADKPSMACLASRIPYGEEITLEKLEKVEKAEKFLKALGFSQLRVRCHNNAIARIEIEEKEIIKAVEKRKEIVSELKKIGFNYIALDLQGYRSGSLNEIILRE